MVKRIAVVDNTKLKDMDKKKHIQSLCPVNRKGDECMYFDGNKLFIDEPMCIGCGICANAAPDAIKIINLPEILTKDPIHRYGENAFALYNLPIPVFGKVVGLLGVNGIGKSTAIKILAGILKPNLSNFEKNADIEEIIEYFKGTEAQLYFEKVRKGEIKTAYKPQHVDMIPKQFDGKVIELLEKVDEKKQLNEMAEKFELTKILDRNIKNISGGELQRLAVAATFLKKANLYIFDEITSYLDIKQRLKISKAIRNLADENTAVIVIEHDLIALDYMADLIHILYGRESAFGVVSKLRPTKNGINTFLEGYLKEENVRFRDNKIRFDVKSAVKVAESMLLTKWPKITKKLGDFSLETQEGEINSSEKIGILGENGIGKTSFVKMLAGEIKPDEKNLDLKIKVSYKPQYLDSDSDELVMVVLQEAIQKYETELIRPLNIKSLLLKKINELSGGELQRVAIALCLSRDADLILLDEPSAYLDVEKRLVVSKVISNIVEQRKVSTLVVDHDLLFLDYLSDRLLVFEGEPAVKGIVKGPYDMEKGMNSLLAKLEITMRRDETSYRPRINKLNSVKDREQKTKKKYYYA
ncbi:ribosome biogenesis/translation initiation ATPase RLI [archaeon]|jgi:ATP-binding cassette, sub-family E, member 1|nr:ribosome biogenesis/translation initiation ATPase RLI [archaeon]MBT4271941.1 ribosome biogenesis/translation initiation ATPase RLI [archaeon]MBT4461779.1 ribosome biogenesis/translation initiation ATPase RLI [archaeon]MBT4858206.1 ribosome biogenesis/translation initiation ATPase RLI [archaeon]MBT5424091.1 ribosome biogenesis/translation initiation ATPase RLI [archaeon]